MTGELVIQWMTNISFIQWMTRELDIHWMTNTGHPMDDLDDRYRSHPVDDLYLLVI
jgi:hypothetical protein